MKYFKKSYPILALLLVPTFLLVCDLRAETSAKLSFDISFLRGWEGYVNEESNVQVEFFFPGESAEILIHRGTRDLTDIAIRTDDMLFLPLLGGETYQLHLTVLASKECAILSKFEPIPMREDRLLTEPESCRFTLKEGLNELRCQFKATQTTESDLYSLYIGEVESDTRITIQKMKLHMLVQ